MNVKEPIAVKPLGIANVGVTTMAAVSCAVIEVLVDPDS